MLTVRCADGEVSFTEQDVQNIGYLRNRRERAKFTSYGVWAVTLFRDCAGMDYSTKKQFLTIQNKLLIYELYTLILWKGDLASLDALWVFPWLLLLKLAIELIIYLPPIALVIWMGWDVTFRFFLLLSLLDIGARALAIIFRSQRLPTPQA